MVQFLDPLLIVVLALNFVVLGVSRVRAVVNAVAFQGLLLGILPPLVHQHIGLRGILLMIGMIGLKTFIIPALLLHAMREADVQHEVRSVVRYMYSLLLGAAGTGLALLFSSTLPLANEHTDLLL